MTKEAAEEEEREEDMKWMAALGKIEQIILHFFCIAKRLQRPVLSFFLWRQEKQLDKSQCVFFFQNLRGRWDLAKFGYRSGQRG